MTRRRRATQVRQDQAFKGRQFTDEVILSAVRGVGARIECSASERPTARKQLVTLRKIIDGRSTRSQAVLR
jgi:hypothetical protein